MFLKGFSIKLSATSFRAFNQLIFIFQSIFGLLNLRLLNPCLLIFCAYVNRLFFNLVDLFYSGLDFLFHFLFDFWLDLKFWLLLFFLDKDSLLDRLLGCDLDICSFLVELRGIVQDEFKVAILWLA